MDLIDRQVAINALKEKAFSYCFEYMGGNKITIQIINAEKAYESIKSLPSVQPYTDEEIQKMQELEQAQIQKAFELGKASAEAEQVKSVNINLLLNEEQMEYILAQTKKQISQAQPEWNNRTVACLLADLFDDTCACNYNGIDEWLPEKCEVIDSCPNPVGVACWEQFLKHRAERRTDE